MKRLGNFLNGLYSKYTNLSVLVGNYNLREVDLEKFEKKFGKMSKEELALFILDPANAYELSKFGHESTDYIMSNSAYVTFLAAQRVGIYYAEGETSEEEE